MDFDEAEKMLKGEDTLGNGIPLSPDVTHERDKWTALQMAASNDDIEGVELLLRYGADPLLEDESGCSRSSTQPLRCKCSIHTLSPAPMTSRFISNNSTSFPCRSHSAITDLSRRFWSSSAPSLISDHRPLLLAVALAEDAAVFLPDQPIEWKNERSRSVNSGRKVVRQAQTIAIVGSICDHI